MQDDLINPSDRPKRSRGESRSDDEKEADLTKLAVLRLEGYSAKEMAEMVGLSVQLVYTDLKTIDKQWRELRLSDLNMMKNMAILKLAAVEKNAWDAWRRSFEPAVKKKYVKDKITGKLILVEETVESSVGNPKFLNAVLESIRHTIYLMGLDKIADHGVKILPDATLIDQIQSDPEAIDALHKIILKTTTGNSKIKDAKIIKKGKR